MFDLPQLYTKPSADALLDTLALLTSAPPSWEPSENEDHDKDASALGKRRTARARAVQINPEGVTRYLTSIVGSGLQWITDEEAKEEIWNQASLRLSERSGRTAMGAISRKFRIPSHDAHFELSIHEPALTGDDLGLKTWAASFLLAKRLHKFELVKADHTTKPQILELGSGTGLVGLAMASLGADVVLTDLPSIYPNLARNIGDNYNLVHQNGGSVRGGVLDWTNPTVCEVFSDHTADLSEGGDLLGTKFPVILAADSLYSPEHPRWLVDTIGAWLSNAHNAKVIVEFPLRDAYLPEVEDFRHRMTALGLHVLEEGEERGYDDWGSPEGEDDEAGLVRCWWSCWGRTAVA